MATAALRSSSLNVVMSSGLRGDETPPPPTSLICEAPWKSRSRTLIPSSPTLSVIAPLMVSNMLSRAGSRGTSRGMRRSACPPVVVIIAPDGKMRGPGITPVSIACLKEKTGPPRSRTVVKPRCRVRLASAVELVNMVAGSPDRRAVTGTAQNSVCQCASMRPGISMRPPQSMIVASTGGGALPVSTGAMRLPSTRTWTFDCRLFDLPSNSLACRNRILAGGV